MPRAPKSTAVATPVAATPAVAEAPAKKSRARKAEAPAVATTPAPAVEAPAKSSSSSKKRRDFTLVVDSVTAVEGPAFNATAYSSGVVPGSDKKARVYKNFTGFGPLQASKKAFTQIRKHVNVGNCSYRFSVADVNGKTTEYTFSCKERDLSSPDALKAHTISKTNKDGKKTEFVDRWDITYVSSNPRRTKSSSAEASSGVAAASTPAPEEQAQTKLKTIEIEILR
jgi:hypothetical protein